MSKLTVDIKVGETLFIGGTTVKLEKKSGQMARLEVTADSNTEIRIPKTAARMSVLQESTGDHHVQHPL